MLYVPTVATDKEKSSHTAKPFVLISCPALDTYTVSLSQLVSIAIIENDYFTHWRKVLCSTMQIFIENWIFCQKLAVCAHWLGKR